MKRTTWLVLLAVAMVAMAFTSAPTNAAGEAIKDPGAPGEQERKPASE